MMVTNDKIGNLGRRIGSEASLAIKRMMMLGIVVGVTALAFGASGTTASAEELRTDGPSVLIVNGTRDVPLSRVDYN